MFLAYTLILRGLIFFPPSASGTPRISRTLETTWTPVGTSPNLLHLVLCLFFATSVTMYILIDSVIAQIHNLLLWTLSQLDLKNISKHPPWQARRYPYKGLDGPSRQKHYRVRGQTVRNSATPECPAKPLLAAASPRAETAGQVDGASRQIGDTTASAALIMLARQSGTALDVLIRITTEDPPLGPGQSAFPSPTTLTEMWACRCSALGPSSTSSSPSSHVRSSSLRLQRPDATSERENRPPPTVGSHSSPQP